MLKVISILFILVIGSIFNSKKTNGCDIRMTSCFVKEYSDETETFNYILLSITYYDRSGYEEKVEVFDGSGMVKYAVHYSYDTIGRCISVIKEEKGLFMEIWKAATNDKGEPIPLRWQTLQELVNLSPDLYDIKYDSCYNPVELIYYYSSLKDNVVYARHYEHEYW